MNTLGQPRLISTDRAESFRLCDPREVRLNRARFRRDAVPLLSRANSFYCPAGRWPSCGWVLLPRNEYVKLNAYSTTLELKLGDPTKPDNVDTLSKLAVVQAQCVTRGIASDVNALYLIELTDARGILHNRWFQAPITSAYNIRSPAYPQTFHPSSMNGGTTWTWTTMLQDMWTQMNTIGGGILGTWPGLPSVPSGTPEGFWFVGVPIWYAFNDVVEHLGLSLVCNLTASAPFTIVTNGVDDPVCTAQRKL